MTKESNEAQLLNKSFTDLDHFILQGFFFY